MRHFHITALITILIAGILAYLVATKIWGWQVAIVIALRTSGLISSLMDFVMTFFN